MDDAAKVVLAEAREALGALETKFINNCGLENVSGRLDCAKITVGESDLVAFRNLISEYERLHKLVNTPEILDFAKAMQLEAVFQRERWGSEHDGGKTDADWFWLIGYLGGKALHNPNVTEKNALKKRLHRIVTVAAAACNWHAAVLGQTDMRPGIEPPVGVSE